MELGIPPEEDASYPEGPLTYGDALRRGGRTGPSDRRTAGRRKADTKDNVKCVGQEGRPCTTIPDVGTRVWLRGRLDNEENPVRWGIATGYKYVGKERRWKATTDSGRERYGKPHTLEVVELWNEQQPPVTTDLPVFRGNGALYREYLTHNSVRISVQREVAPEAKIAPAVQRALTEYLELQGESGGTTGPANDEGGREPKKKKRRRRSERSGGGKKKHKGGAKEVLDLSGEDGQKPGATVDAPKKAKGTDAEKSTTGPKTAREASGIGANDDAAKPKGTKKKRKSGKSKGTPAGPTLGSQDAPVLPEVVEGALGIAVGTPKTDEQKTAQEAALLVPGGDKASTAGATANKEPTAEQGAVQEPTAEQGGKKPAATDDIESVSTTSSGSSSEEDSELGSTSESADNSSSSESAEESE